MSFEIVSEGITGLRCDAIVNAANEQLQMGGGVCGAIFAAAGAEELQEACDLIGYCAPGDVAVTSGFHLPAIYLYHTVGPRYKDGDCGEEAILRRCYQSCLKKAAEEGVGSIAFPLISAGIFAYPTEKALAVAVEELKKAPSSLRVVLTLVDPKAKALAKLHYPDDCRFTA